jgi:hypothetical protein
MTDIAKIENDLNNPMPVGALLDLLLKFPMDTSVMLSGPPGIGKTAIGEEFAKQLNARCKTFLAATMDPTDLSGVPHCKEENKTTVFYPPEEFLELTDWASDKTPMVALFDDLTTASDQVQAPLFRMFHKRMIGQFRIRDNVFLLGTGNRVEDKAAAHDMASPLANRFWHADVEVDDKAWIEWAQGHGIQPELIAYLRTRPEQLFCFDPNNLRRAFATPRSIEMASRLQEKVGKDHPYLFNVIAGAVGKEWASEYTAYLRNITALVPPQEILADPKKCKVPNPGQIDVLHATLQSLLYYVIKNQTADNVIKTFQYAKRILPIDISMILVHGMLRYVVRVNNDPTFRANVCSSPEFVWAIEEQGFVLEGHKGLK